MQQCTICTTETDETLIKSLYGKVQLIIYKHIVYILYLLILLYCVPAIYL